MRAGISRGNTCLLLALLVLASSVSGQIPPPPGPQCSNSWNPPYCLTSSDFADYQYCLNDLDTTCAGDAQNVGSIQVNRCWPHRLRCGEICSCEWGPNGLCYHCLRMQASKSI